MTFAFDRSKLPMPQPPFRGKIGKTYRESEAAWPEIPKPPEDAPNIVIILLDDVGFGQVSTFGGPVPTPALDKLAANGLKYNRFHTTAICGPSRAALMTGRNHHNCGSGFLAEWATGFPSYNTMISRTTATVGRILKENGYSTSWFGKNHNTPDWGSSIVGPFDRSPTGLGFDYFYGFIGGETHQYYPVLFENTVPVEPNKSPEEGYHFMSDMSDKAIAWLRYSKSVNPDKPALLYFAPGAAHAPHHSPAEWRERFKGQFDQGWDKVREETYQRQLQMGIIPPGTENTPRPEWCPAWDSLSAGEQRLYARFMENFAGFLAFTDHECGRLLDAVAQLPDANNTLIFYMVGDNGASSEGRLTGTINEIMNLNGIPSNLEENLKRIDEIGAPDTEPHYPLGWAWAGNAPFQWVKQVASHLGGTRNPMVVGYSKSHDLAVHYPERLAELKQLFDQECEKYSVYPLDDRGVGRGILPKPPPGGADPNRKHFTYYPGAIRLPENAAPNIKNRSHRIDIAIAKGGEGVLLAEGGQSAGFVLYVKNGKPIYHYNFFDIERTSVESSLPLAEGKSTLSFEFRYDGGGAGKGGEAVLYLDNQEVGKQRIERTVYGRFGIDTFGVGCDTGSPVCKDYKPPFSFTGAIEKVDIFLGESGLSEEEERVLQAKFRASKEY